MKKVGPTESRVAGVLLLVSSFLIGSPSLFAYGTVSYKPAAEWVVTENVKQQENSAELDLSVRYLMSDQQYHLNQTGLAYYQKVSQQIVHQKGLEQVSELEFRFNEAFENLVLHHINIIRNGQKINKLEPSEVKVFRKETSVNQRMFDGYITALIILKDVRVGDIIEYSFTIDGFNPIFGEKRFGRFLTTMDVPIENLLLKVHTSKNRKIYFNDQGQKFKRTTSGNNVSYSWKMNNTKRVFNEGEYPSWHNPYQYIEFSEYKNWQEVRVWAEELYSGTALSKDIISQIKQWQQESSTQYEVLSKALQFVQDEIRYFGIEVGDNTHKPNMPEHIFKSRFGDCKDKTILLNGIFKYLDVESYPALVSSYEGRNMELRLPSPAAFNHVILTANYNGETYWLDGTASQQRGGLNNIGFINYERALVLNHKESKLTRVKPTTNSADKVYVDESFLVDNYNGDTLFTVKSSYHGLKADGFRQLISSNGIGQMSKNFLNFYAKYYPSISQNTVVVVTDDEEQNILTTTETYRVTNFAKANSGKWVVRLSASAVVEYLYKPKVLDRKMPFFLKHPIQLKLTQTVTLPDDKFIYWESDSKKISNSLIDYSRTVENNANQLIIKHSYSPKTDHVKPEQMNAFLESLQAVYSSLEYSFAMSGNTSADRKQQENKLRNLVKKLIKK